MKNYSYFNNEKGDYSIAFKVNTEEETLIAFTDSSEKADVIVKALNHYPYHYSTSDEAAQQFTIPVQPVCEWCLGKGYWINEEHEKWPEVQQKIECYHCREATPVQPPQDENIYDSVYMEVVKLVEGDNIQGEMYSGTIDKLKKSFIIKKI